MVMVHLACEAPFNGKKFLAGIPGSSAVTLRNKDEIGTRWEMNSLGSGQFTFLCWDGMDALDIINGPNEDRYLNGNIETGTVQLVRRTGDPFTGTRWLRSGGPDDSTIFTCLHDAKDGPRLLDGHPGPNTVQLLPNTEFLGTRWTIQTPR
ncbi:hypothetical protein ACWIID_45740 [Streptomyces phaeochromogenes]